MIVFAISIVAFVFVTIAIAGVIWVVTERIDQKRYAAAADKWRENAYRKYPALPSIPLQSPESTSFFIQRAEWHAERPHIFREEPQPEFGHEQFAEDHDDDGDD